MDDPIGSHPTRAEQLDILVQSVCRVVGPDDVILDLGCGTGYLEHLLFRVRDDLTVVGVDRKADSLDEARTRFRDRGDRARFIAGDLAEPESIELPVDQVRVVVTALTFHDLSDPQKQAVLRWAAGRLTEDGMIIVYDRFRLTEAALYPLQQAIWNRIAALHGRGMRTADSFEAYLADLSDTNRPARLDDYRHWFAELGLASQVLHLHGNVGLIAAARG